VDAQVLPRRETDLREQRHDVKTEAERTLKTREGDIAKGKPVSSRVDRVRFRVGAKGLLNDYELNGRTSYDEAERRIRLHLDPFFGNMHLSQITTGLIRDYVTHRKATPIVTGEGDTARQRPPSNGEINRELTTLKRIFSLAIQDGALTQRPHVPLLKETNARKGFFERAQLLAVLKYLSRDLQPVMRFAYVTGWRIDSEVLDRHAARSDG
jgi:hypothetical protein